MFIWNISLCVRTTGWECLLFLMTYFWLPTPCLRYRLDYAHLEQVSTVSTKYYETWRNLMTQFTSLQTDCTNLDTQQLRNCLEGWRNGYCGGQTPSEMSGITPICKLFAASNNRRKKYQECVEPECSSSCSQEPATDSQTWARWIQPTPSHSIYLRLILGYFYYFGIK